MLCHVLAEEGDRLWLAFRKPAAEADGARFVSHYVVAAGAHAVLIDPGGAADFGPLLAAVTDKIDLAKIKAIVLTQPGAHAAGSAGLWAEVLGHATPVHVSEVSVPDVLHVDADLNIQAVGESGGEVPMPDGSGLHLLPAPYLPSAASMTLYDPVARVLYTGDIGTVEGAWADDSTPFSESFSMVGHRMNAFHETWFASVAARDDWIERVRELAVDIVAPRAGPCFRDRDVAHFMSWMHSMDVGVLVAGGERRFLHAKEYAPDAGQHDDDVFDPPARATAPVAPAAAEAPTSAVPEPDADDGDEDYHLAALAARADDAADAVQAPLSVPIPEPTWPTEPDTETDPMGGLEPPADPYDYEDDAEVSRLVEALDDEDMDDDLLDDDDYEIVYIDEDGNEIDPSEIDDEDDVEEEMMLEGNDEQRLEFPPGQMFRLITRSDFDGLVCAVLLEEMDLINDILFVHPNQMQEGEIEVSETDISTNLPYTPGIFAAFDHHLSEVTRLGKHYDNHIIDPLAPSAARVVYDYFGGKERFPDVSEEMMDAVDKADSAQFELDEVIDADGWPLLSFIMDSRTGLGRFRGFRVPNYELMMSLIDYCRRYPIEDILEHPDVKERVELYREHEAPAKEQIKRCTTVHGNLAVVDYREEEHIYVCNRFMVYALFPDCNISMHVIWGRAQQNTVFAVGKSIFNRTSNTNVGDLMLTYGGGGHRNAGTCQADNALAEVVKDALVQRITADG